MVDLRVRNKPIHLWSTDFQQRYQEFSGNSNFIPQMVLGQLNFHMQRKEVGPLSQTICIKMDQRNLSERANI